MSVVSSLMDDVGVRLTSVASGATREVRRRTVGARLGSNNAATYLSLSDTHSFHPTAQLDGRGTTVAAVGSPWRQPIIGIDSTNGRMVEIDPADVRSVPLHDADGNPIGALFPSQPKDIENFVPWARMPDRMSDLYYRTAYQRFTARKLGEKTIYEYGPYLEAPWAKEVLRTGIPPIYVIAHANPGAFTVQVRTNGSFRSMFLDGGPYAGVVAANPHVLRATEGNEFGTLIPISCSPAQPGSATGQLAAEGLINEAEMDRNIHVPTTVMLLGRDEASGQSWLGADALVTKVGLHQQEFTSYWGSPYSHEDRP